jgi:DNA-binding response OmpR family regulator
MKGWRAVSIVLVVGVDEALSLPLVEHLERKGHRVLVAADGRDVCEAVTHATLDAVVLQLKPEVGDGRAMDGLGGFVWALASEHGIPLIVTTDRKRDVRRLREWQVTAFVERDDPTAVDVALRQVLRHRTTRRLFRLST